MKHKVICLFFFLLMVAKAHSQSVSELLKQADELIEIKFDNVNQLKVMEQAYKLEPNNFEVLWRMSRAYVDYGEHLPDKTDAEKDQQLKQYEKSLDFANKSININPGSMIGYLHRAIANGRIALFKGVFKAISLVNSVKDDLEKAIRLNNGGNNHQSVAHYVLARAHAEVCEKPYLIRLPLTLGWGDRDDATTHYETAIKLRPNFIMFRVDAAKNYIELDEWQKAKEHLYSVANLPNLDEDDEVYRIETKKLLEEIKSR
ncbi:MAG: tetratricopeptide repeat protein [Ignavibacteria bacterium]|nr:tetratricopeptide repeat protein [Ignavibacteria bacterium]